MNSSTTIVNYGTEEKKYLYYEGRRGKPILDPVEIKEHAGKLLSQINNLRRRGGGVIIVSHEPIMERSAYDLIKFTEGFYVKGSQKMVVVNAPFSPYFRIKTIGANLPDLMIINAPRFPDLEELFEVCWKNRVIVATGLSSEWQDILFKIPIPYHVYSLTIPPGRITLSTEKEAVVIRDYQGKGKLIQEAYFLTAIMDSLSIPLPFTLLSRALGASERETAEALVNAKNLLYTVEQEKPAGTMVTTRGPSFAMSYLKGQDEKIVEGYVKLLYNYNASKIIERYALNNLFRRLILIGKIRQAKKLIIQNIDRMILLWQYPSLSAAEITSWGKILHQLRLYEQSDVVFKAGLGRFPDNVILITAYACMLADWSLIMGTAKAKECQRWFYKARQMDPNNLHTLHSLAEMEREWRNFTESRRLFDEILQKNPDNEFARTSLAVMELESDNYEQAQKEIANVLKNHPENLYANHLAGIWKSKMLDYDDAQMHFQRVLKLDPDNVATLTAQGMVQLERGHWDDAGKLLQKALKLNPDNPMTMHAMGKLLYEQQQYDEAAAMFKAVLEIEPGNVHALTAFAETQAKLGNRQIADDYFSRASEIQRENPIIYTAWGIAILSRAPKKSFELLNTALRKGSNLVTMNTLGKYWAVNGDMENARRIFAGTVRSAQGLNKIISLNTSADAEACAGNYDEAIKLADQALKLDPENEYTIRLRDKIMNKLKP